MPKILRILNRFNIGGPVLNAGILTRYLAPEFETLLIGGCNEPYEGNALPKLQEMGIEPKVLPMMNRSIHPLRDFQTYKEISRIIDEYKPDVVHTHASKAGAIGRAAALRKGVKAVVHTYHGHVFHSYFSPLKTNIYINLERQLARKTSKIIVLCEKQKKELTEEFTIAPPDKFSVIPLGFDLTGFRNERSRKRVRFREKYKIAEEEIVIGIVGRLTKVKNHRFFLQAFSTLKKTIPKKIRAFIIGDGELKDELVETCGKYRLKCMMPNERGMHNPDVIFTSWIEEMENVYPGLDIVALCSLNEGTPVSVIEAQASGTPVVAVDVGGVADVILPGKTALLVKNNCLEEFTQTLEKLVVDQSLRREMASHGWNHVKSVFHYSKLVEKTGRLYEGLLHGEIAK